MTETEKEIDSLAYNCSYSNTYTHTDTNYTFDNSIEVTSRTNIKQLKHLLSIKINLPENKFIIKKFSPQGAELNKLTEEISSIAKSSMNIYIELGTPLMDYEIKLNIYLCEIEINSSRFSINPYKLTELGNIIVDERISLRELKSIIMSN